MKTTSNAIRTSFTESGTQELTLTLKSRTDISELKDIIANGKELTVEIKQYRQKRSLDANSYCWVLISKIADLLRISKDEVYIDMLTKYGQREPKLVSVITEAVDVVKRATNNHCVVVGESELNDKIFCHLAILIGSSQYDSRQMAILIDGVILEAKDLGIDTLTESEKNLLLEDWGKC